MSMGRQDAAPPTEQRVIPHPRPLLPGPYCPTPRKPEPFLRTPLVKPLSTVRNRLRQWRTRMPIFCEPPGQNPCPTPEQKTAFGIGEDLSANPLVKPPPRPRPRPRQEREKHRPHAPASRARPPPPPPVFRTRSVSTPKGRVRRMIPVSVCGTAADRRCFRLLH